MSLQEPSSVAATVIGGLRLCMALNVKAASWRGDMLVAQTIVVLCSPAPSFSGGKYAPAPGISGELERWRRVTFDSDGPRTCEHATVQTTSEPPL